MWPVTSGLLPVAGRAAGPALGERKRWSDKIYPGMSANYWIYSNAGVDPTRPSPLMVWQDGEAIAGSLDPWSGCDCRSSPTTWCTRS